MPNVQKATTWNVCKKNSVIGRSITKSGETNVTKSHQELIDCTQTSSLGTKTILYLAHVVVSNSSGLHAVLRRAARVINLTVITQL